jgi:PilZ domain-containing protein
MDNRLRRRIPIQCSVVLANDDFVTEGTVLNLGVAGCAVASKKALSRGEYVKLDLYLPDHKPALQVPVAKVRWADNGQYGMEFLKFAWEHHDRLGPLVNTYETSHDPQKVVSVEPRLRNKVRPLMD